MSVDYNGMPAMSVPAPGRVGQGTAVEQTRAAAQVVTAVQVAKQYPRDIGRAVGAMRQSCQQMRLAERAFYAFPRGGQTVTGASVYLARELARCWGNVDYGVTEMRRDDEFGQSEILAVAWDLETNARVYQVFIVPHRRDKTVRGEKVQERLADMRDIYENNANNGARRLRECIFAILPPWFVEDAKEICAKTLKDGGGVPLPLRASQLIEWYSGKLGVSVEQLEQKVGRPNARWNEHDVAQLSVIGRSIGRGELRAEEEFPPERVTIDEIVGQAQNGAAQPQEPAETDDPPVSDARRRGLHDLFRDAGIDDLDERAAIVSKMVGREIGQFKDLRRSEARRVDDILQGLASPGRTLTEYMAERMASDPATGTGLHADPSEAS